MAADTPKRSCIKEKEKRTKWVPLHGFVTHFIPVMTLKRVQYDMCFIAHFEQLHYKKKFEKKSNVKCYF